MFKKGNSDTRTLRTRMLGHSDNVRAHLIGSDTIQTRTFGQCPDCPCLSQYRRTSSGHIIVRRSLSARRQSTRRSSSSISTHRSTSRTSYSGRQGRQRTYSRHSRRSHSPDRGRSTTRNLPRLTNNSTSESNI